MVLLILGILSAVAVQSMHIAGEREGLAAERLRADIRYAQGWAMSVHLRTWVVFDTGANRYSLYVENPANPGKVNRVAMTDPLTLASYQVSLGDDETGQVALASPDFDGATEVEFDRRGLAHDGDGNALTANGSVRLGAAWVLVSPAGWVGVQ